MYHIARVRDNICYSLFPENVRAAAIRRRLIKLHHYTNDITCEVLRMDLSARHTILSIQAHSSTQGCLIHDCCTRQSFINIWHANQQIHSLSSMVASTKSQHFASKQSRPQDGYKTQQMRGLHSTAGMWYNKASLWRLYRLDLGALKLCTLPLSTPANGSMTTFISAGCFLEKAVLTAACSSLAVLTK